MNLVPSKFTVRSIFIFIFVLIQVTVHNYKELPIAGRTPRSNMILSLAQPSGSHVILIAS